MLIFSGTTEFHSEEKTALAIGKFDGLHRGHEHLLAVLQKKKAEGLLSAAFTFLTPPMQKEQKVLTTKEEKEELFRSAGIDMLIECPFTEEIRNMEPGAFLKRLKEQLRVECIAAGTDFMFGAGRSGDTKTLLAHAKEFSYEAVIVSKVKDRGMDISSTRIRGEIEKGDLKEANRLLGYPYFISGTIVHGNRIGHEIGIPTINVLPPDEKLLPPFGVFVSESVLKGRKYRGITNIGKKPTVSDAEPISMETHLFDFQEETYGDSVRTELLSFLRPEKRFSDVRELREQIRQDIEKARELKI